MKIVEVWAVEIMSRNISLKGYLDKGRSQKRGSFGCKKFPDLEKQLTRIKTKNY